MLLQHPEPVCVFRPVGFFFTLNSFINLEVQIESHLSFESPCDQLVTYQMIFYAFIYSIMEAKNTFIYSEVNIFMDFLVLFYSV